MKCSPPLLLAALLACPEIACEPNDAAFLDGAVNPGLVDASPPPSDVPVLLAVDFAVENCPSFDPAALTCTGHVPLAARFVPLATTTVTKYLWDFGDGTYSSEATPNHVYAKPGAYPVTIIATGVGGGVVTKARAGFIVAQANGAGQACDANVQCNPGYTCVCGGDAPCAAGPARGFCASTCPTGRCATGQVCAGLLTAPSPTTTDPWQTDLCLASCSFESDCAAGLHCRTLPPGPAGSAWVHGCFADVPADIGEPCRDADGRLRDDRCAAGTCADLGALGMCTMSCSVESCPQGSDCAVLGDGRILCLRPCTSFACTSDPLLGCFQPNPGDLGYQLASSGNSSAASTHCVPKFCTSDDVCSPTGSCAIQSDGGHCVFRP